MASATAVFGGRDSGIPAKHDEIVSTIICEACLTPASLPTPSATMSRSPRRVLVWRTVAWLSQGTFPRSHWLAMLMAKDSAVDTLLIVNSSCILFSGVSERETAVQEINAIAPAAGQRDRLHFMPMGFRASFPMIFHTLACQGDQR